MPQARCFHAGMNTHTHDEQQLDEEPDESHDDEPQRRPRADLEVLCVRCRVVQNGVVCGIEACTSSRQAAGSLFTLWTTSKQASLLHQHTRTLPVRLGATLHEARAVLGEVAQRLPRHLADVHFVSEMKNNLHGKELLPFHFNQ